MGTVTGQQELEDQLREIAEEKTGEGLEREKCENKRPEDECRSTSRGSQELTEGIIADH